MNLTGERREVELTEAAMDAGVPQGNLGHHHGHGGCTVAAADGDAGERNRLGNANMGTEASSSVADMPTRPSHQAPTQRG